MSQRTVYRARPDDVRWATWWPLVPRTVAIGAWAGGAVGAVAAHELGGNPWLIVGYWGLAGSGVATLWGWLVRIRWRTRGFRSWHHANTAYTLVQDVLEVPGIRTIADGIWSRLSDASKLEGDERRFDDVVLAVRQLIYEARRVDSDRREIDQYVAQLRALRASFREEFEA